MGQPSNPKASRKSSSFGPSPHWKRKLGKKHKTNSKAHPNPNPSSNTSVNPNRRKQRAAKIVPQEHATYRPPRLQDLQFQNKLKAYRHFTGRRDATPAPAHAFNPMLEATVSSVSGFPVPTFNVSRLFLGDTRANGLPQGNLDFPTQGSVYTAGSLGYPVNARSFSVPDRRLINPQGKGVLLPVGTLAFAGNYESGISNPSASVFNIGSTTSGQASTSGAVSTFIKSSAQGEKSSKRHKPYRGPKRGTLGARKRVGTDAPAAPRNTTSFLMRAKRSGGIASFVSPSPVTPAVIPTPVMSPAVTSMGLGDEANHEWGVDDYGSMNGLIRLRSLALGDEMGDEYGDTNDSESEVEQGAQSVQQLEERLDHDVSRFVMTYPASRPHNMGLDDLDIQRIDDQDSHIANLQEENMNLKERLYSMQQEVGDLRRRLRVLEGFSSGDDATLGASPDRSVANVPCL